MADKKIIYVEAKPKAEPPVEEGLPPWMATFADMVTLLLCFFVLLLSFANQDIANFETLKGSMNRAFGVQKLDKTGKKLAFSSSEFSASSVKKDAKKSMAALEVQIRSFINEGKEAKDMAVNSDQNGVLVRVATRALFKTGTAELRPGADKALDMIASVLKTKKFRLIVRGHTDDTPTKGNVYASNWELSAARAARCLRYILGKSGVSAQRAKAVGYAGTRPLVPNTSKSNRSINRRVGFYYQPGTTNW